MEYFSYFKISIFFTFSSSVDNLPEFVFLFSENGFLCRFVEPSGKKKKKVKNKDFAVGCTLIKIEQWVLK